MLTYSTCVLFIVTAFSNTYQKSKYSPDLHQKHHCLCFSNWLLRNKWSTEFRQNLITQKPNTNFNFNPKACLKCAAWVAASSLIAALATRASILMPHLQRLCSVLWGCEVLVNPTRYPWTHLSSMSESFNPAAVSLQSLLADGHQMLVPLPPLLYSLFSHKQYITVILSSSRPPAARPARLPAYLLTLILLRQDVVSFAVLRPGTVQKGDILYGSCTSQRIFGLCDQVLGFKCDLVLLASQYSVRGWCFPHEESVLWRQLDLQGL